MKRSFILWAALLTPGLVRAETACVPNQTQVIQSQARCVDEGGISIGIGDEEGAKVACMESKAVQNRCGPDGSLTRLHAYETWIKMVKNFEDTCTLRGGTFSYQDPTFLEPGDESYCRQAVPEIGTSMFEEPLCNYRSTCPAVTVVCERTCPEPTIVSRF
jgi:hypothetical protein